MKTIHYLCLLSFVLLTAACHAQPAKTTKTDLSVAEFDKLSKETPDALIVDVRSPVEYVEGYIPNAVNIDWNGKYYTQVKGTMDKNKTYFLYCLGGTRSEEMADDLRKEGFTKIYTLKDGIEAWKKEGMPIATHNVNLRDKQ
jgi:rhodanese-related sulfurtransferase